jgi:hypothetical protein
MCLPATCRTCKKTTYSGCGRHVKEAVSGVPSRDRCKCDDGNPAKRTLFGWSQR